MAKNNSIIKTLAANSFSGTFEAPVDSLTVEGNLNTNAQKVLSSVNGRVKNASGLQLLAFNAFKNGESFRYSFSDISDLSVLPSASAAIASALSALQAELTPVEQEAS
jgi:hypothetical protein